MQNALRRRLLLERAIVMTRISHDVPMRSVATARIAKQGTASRKPVYLAGSLACFALLLSVVPSFGEIQIPPKSDWSDESRTYTFRSSESGALEALALKEWSIGEAEPRARLTIDAGFTTTVLDMRFDEESGTFYHRLSHPPSGWYLEIASTFVSATGRFEMLEFIELLRDGLIVEIEVQLQTSDGVSAQATEIPGADSGDADEQILKILMEEQPESFATKRPQNLRRVLPLLRRLIENERGIRQWKSVVDFAHELTTAADEPEAAPAAVGE